AASTSRTDRPRKNEQITNVSSGYVRATPLPTIRDSKTQSRRLPDPRPLDLDRTRGRRDLLRPLIPIAMRDRRLAPLVAGAAQKLGQLILQRLLEDQPRTEPADLLDRIGKLTGIGDHGVQLVTQPL